MHIRDPHTARVMRRASTGPAALMARQAVRPYVPDRGSAGLHGLGFYVPSRQLGSLGAASIVGQSVTGVKVGVAASSVTTAVGTGVASAVGAGAAAGSVVPIIGTAIGAIIGLVASGVFNRKKDPEDYNFQQAMAMSSRSGPQSVLDIGNKYLVLAGLFDLRPDQIKGNIPIYKKYGRMGEQRFVNDLCAVIYQAAQAGQITANDTPQSVFGRIVQPWINSFGFGTMSDSNADMITYILLGMTAEYIMGLQNRWAAVGGDLPFTTLPPFKLPVAQPLAPAPINNTATASVTPSPVASEPNSALTELQRYQAGQYPQSGAVVAYMKDSATGQFMAVPAGATYVGLDPTTGWWVVSYATGQYYLKNGTLQIYPPPAQTALAVTPATASASVPLNTDTSVSAGGGSAPYIAPSQNLPSLPYLPPAQSTVQPQIVDNTTGSIDGTVLLAGGAAVVLLLLLSHKRAR